MASDLLYSNLARGLFFHELQPCYKIPHKKYFRVSLKSGTLLSGHPVWAGHSLHPDMFVGAVCVIQDIKSLSDMDFLVPGSIHSGLAQNP